MTRFPFSLRLEPMSAGELADYLCRQGERFAAAKAAAETLPLELALTAAQQQLQRILPQGQATRGHAFVKFVVAATDCSRLNVGEAWYCLQETSAGKEGYLYDIFVPDSFRRTGYGSAGLAAIELELKRSGCRQLWLNVFADNVGARSFYEAGGYHVGTMHMTKRL